MSKVFGIMKSWMEIWVIGIMGDVVVGSWESSLGAERGGVFWCFFGQNICSYDGHNRQQGELKEVIIDRGRPHNGSSTHQQLGGHCGMLIRNTVRMDRRLPVNDTSGKLSSLFISYHQECTN